MSKIYLDYAATTPLDERVEGAMLPYFREKFGNPGSLHFFGQEAVAAVDEAREVIAKSIGSDFREVIFTGSATEANNLVLRSVIGKIKNPRIIISTIEHESIINTARDLERNGVEVIYLPVNNDGVVDLEKLKEALNEQTVLVSIMYANNEVGVIQPIMEISNIVRSFRESGINTNYPLLHSDAVQALQFLNCSADELDIDLMTLSAHKIYGPKGMGALYLRQVTSDTRHGVNTPVSYAPFNMLPIVTGGGQEFGLRSGTENVPGIIGFAKAVELVLEKRKQENVRIRELKNYFWQELKKVYPKAEINGADISDKQLKTSVLPNILNIYFPAQSAGDLLIKLDAVGVAVSSGSACSARSPKLSHVLQALGLAPERIKSSLRFSFGRFTTKEELQETLKKLQNVLRSVRG